MSSLLNLLTSRHFLPLFVTQFLGACNDNVFRSAMVILLTYGVFTSAYTQPHVLVTLAATCFIFPFFMFSATAGQIADKHEKSSLIRLIKLIEIPLMVAAAIGFYLGEVWFLMFTLFLMGTQSTFFGPLKYSILPDHLRKEDLVGGNALIEIGTFVSILLGSVVGGLLILTDYGPFYVSLILITVACVGWLTSLPIPTAKAGMPSLNIGKNIFRETKTIISYTREVKRVFSAILSISWFWLVGTVFLTQFPVYGKGILAVNERVVTVFLLVFTIGIAVGSLSCRLLLRNTISTFYVPLGALGVSLSILLFTLATQGYATAQKLSEHTVSQTLHVSDQFTGVAKFLSIPEGWFVLLSLLTIACAGGLYIVPLYVVMQYYSHREHRSRVIAGNNVINALAMVISSLMTFLLYLADFTVMGIFSFLAVCNLFFVWFTWKHV